MLRYISVRVGQAILVVWLTYTVVFFAIQLLPSDPITIFLSSDSAVDPALIDAMKSFYGYDKPVLDQYFAQLLNLLQGNFGYSLANGQTVTDKIGSVVGSTIALASTALVFAVLIAGLIAVAASLGRNNLLKRFLLNLPPLFSAIPVFWLGLLLLQLLSLRLKVMSLFPDGSVLSFVVPAFVLSIPISAPIAQVFLKSIETTLAQPFVDVLRAKGASRSWIFFRHVLKNAAAPALTVLGITIGALFAGSVITETVFSRAGLGQVLLKAVTEQDIALIQGLVLLTAIVFVAVNLVVDLLYPLLDPRILRSQNRGATRALNA